MFFSDGLAKSSVKDNGSKTKFFEGVQVYPEDLFRVVVHQGPRLAQGFLNTKEGSEFLGCGRPEFYF